MPAWVWITALAAVAFVGWVALGRGWFRAVLYSWRHASHVIDLTQTEVTPGAEYGSMNLTDEPGWLEFTHVGYPPGLMRRYGPEGQDPEWWQQVEAELSPEALDPLPAPPEFLTTIPGTRMTIYTDGSLEFSEEPEDPGPGGALVSSSPPPGPDHDGRGEMLTAIPGPHPPPLTRLADTGEIRDVRMLADVGSYMARMDAECSSWLAVRIREWATI